MYPKEKLYEALFFGFSFVVRHIPTQILSVVVGALSRLAYLLDIRRKRVAFINLNFAYGGLLTEKEKNSIVLSCYKNLLHNVISVISNANITKDELLAKTSFENDEAVFRLLKEGKKIVFATAHYGNWEFLGNALAARFGVGITVVGRELDASALNEPLRLSRERFGGELVSKKGAMRHLVRALKDGRAIGILVDQNTVKNEGVEVEFFGKKALQTPVVSILSRRFGAAIVPVFCDYDGFDRYKLFFYEPIFAPQTESIDNDILECTQAQSTVIERHIRKNPSGWLWFHRRWKNTHRELYEAKLKTS